MSTMDDKLFKLFRGDISFASLDKKIDFGSSSPTAMYDCRFNPNIINKGSSTSYGRGNINIISSGSSSMSRSTPNFGGFGSH